MEKELLWVIRSDFLNVIYTLETHEQTVKKYLFYNKLYNALNFILITGILILLIFQLADLEEEQKSFLLIIWIVFTVWELILIIFNGIYKIDDKVSVHKGTANNLRELRDDYKILMGIIIWKWLSKKDILGRVENLKKIKDGIYRNCLPTKSKEYKKAQKFLDPENRFIWWASEVNEDEIDYNLPSYLRLWKQ